MDGTTTFAFTDGPGNVTEFYAPRGVAVSPDGTTLYVGDYSNHRIRMIQATEGQ